MNINVLKEPLNAKNIKTRSDKGAKVGYITTAHAITEANRAFLHNGWSCETVEMNLVQTDKKPKKGNSNIELFYVGYTAKVKVTVDGLVREGFGFGQGIDQDLGKSHESATKEAESDALKRALRTFGNIFGLALYDKDNGNITSANEQSYQVINEDQVRHLRNMIAETKSDELKLCSFANVDKIEDLNGSYYQQIISMLNKKKEKAKDEQK